MCIYIYIYIYIHIYIYIYIYGCGTIFWASAMASASSADFETPFWILVESSSYLSSLSTREVLDFSSSWSHQSLCSSSFFCSSMRRKIIFSISLLTLSKGPVRWAATSVASCSRALECAALAVLRRSSTAFIFGSLDAACGFCRRVSLASVSLLLNVYMRYCL